MPNLKIPAKSLEPPEQMPAGVYDVMFTAIKPSLTSGKDQAGNSKEKSVNLNVQLKVVNNANGELNGKTIRDFMNVNAGWVLKDFVHCFGHELVGDAAGGYDLPGDILGPDGIENCSKWTYQGPLLNEQGTIELAEVDGIGKNAGKKFTNIKRYICRVPGCQEKHSENLLRTS